MRKLDIGLCAVGIYCGREPFYIFTFGDNAVAVVQRRHGGFIRPHGVVCSGGLHVLCFCFMRQYIRLIGFFSCFLCFYARKKSIPNVLGDSLLRICECDVRCILGLARYKIKMVRAARGVDYKVGGEVGHRGLDHNVHCQVRAGTGGSRQNLPVDGIADEWRRRYRFSRFKFDIRHAHGAAEYARHRRAEGVDDCTASAERRIWPIVFLREFFCQLRGFIVDRTRLYFFFNRAKHFFKVIFRHGRRGVGAAGE